MKNKKIMLVFILIIALLVAVVPYVKAAKFIIDETENNVNTETNNTTVDNTENKVNTETNTNTNTNINTNVEIKNEVVNDTASNTLPQTGVAENSTLFIFITICLISAVYAYIKVRNYNNI